MRGPIPSVVQQSAGREVTQRGRGQVQRLADLDGQQRDPARVALGGAVVLAEAQHRRAHAGAEVGLL